LVVTVAVLFALVVVGGRVVGRRLRAARLTDTIAVVSFADIPGELRRRQCPCGRSPDALGERRSDAGVIVTRECVCGRTERVTFVLAQ
jgi:hypothetical protein